MRVQAHVTTENGKLFDISLHHGDVSFEILEFTKEEIFKLVDEILTQVELLEEAHQGFDTTVTGDEKDG